MDKYYDLLFRVIDEQIESIECVDDRDELSEHIDRLRDYLAELKTSIGVSQNAVSAT